MKMSLAVITAALLLLSACGPSARGPLVLPPPPALRPGHGLPTYDPTSPQVKPEPGPTPRRVLPQTPDTRRGPGIWASETPPTAERGPEIFGTPPLEPEHSNPGHVAEMSHCANMMRRASEMAGEDGSGLTARGRKCVAARLYLVCAEDWEKHATDVAREEAARRTATALAYKERMCVRSKPTDGPVDGVVGAVAFRYNEIQDLLRRKMDRAR
jgi:hypothetical protein